MALLSDRRGRRGKRSTQKAYALWRRSSNEDELAVTKAHLAELELYKPNPDYNLALRLIDEAFATPSKSFKAIPRYYPIHVRGQILLKPGRKPLPWRNFESGASGG